VTVLTLFAIYPLIMVYASTADRVEFVIITIKTFNNKNKEMFAFTSVSILEYIVHLSSVL
jgi:hypothetical protein